MSVDFSVPQNLHLRVDVARQVMYLLSDGREVKSWPVSTSKFGLGTESGSFKTPLGKFRIYEKIGTDAPAWTLFRARVPVGVMETSDHCDDAVLSRILWLEGCDWENQNTRERYIYIHGTNQEHLIGRPASHGCVRMRNQDVIELFDIMPRGAQVEIV